MKIALIGTAIAAAVAAPLAVTMAMLAGGTAVFVPDPFMSAHTAGVPGYERALDALQAAQSLLAKKEEALMAAIIRCRRLPQRCDDVTAARAAVTRAAEGVSAAEETLRNKYAGKAARAVPVEQDTVLVMFRDESTEEQRSDVLERHGLIERSRLPSISLYVTAVAGDPGPTAEGRATRVRAIVERLKSEEWIVETAVQNVLLGPNFIPSPNAQRPRNWLAVHPQTGQPLDPLVLSGFPASWNFNDALRRRNASIAVGVLDAGFTKDKPNDLDIITACENPAENAHGTIVAAIIGARFDDMHGIDGAAPFARIYGCGPKIRELEAADIDGLEEEDLPMVMGRVAFDAFIRGLETLLKLDIRVINASIGYNWSFFKIRPTGDTRIQAVVESQGKMVRKILKDHGNVIIVSAAGNDCTSAPCEPPTWTNPFNWAAIGEDTSLFPSELSIPSPNVIIVEALERTGRTKLPASNEGGDIRAIGELIPSIVAAERQNDGTISDDVDFCGTGTSCAAPLVTAAVAQMLAANPMLRPDAIKRNLGIPASPAPRLNAFTAVRASSQTFRKDLANRDINDDDVDFADFTLFRIDFRAGTRLSRSDLDGDGNVDRDDLQIMIEAWTDTSTNPQNLPGLLNQ